MKVEEDSLPLRAGIVLYYTPNKVNFSDGIPWNAMVATMKGRPIQKGGREVLHQLPMIPLERGKNFKRQIKQGITQMTDNGLILSSRRIEQCFSSFVLDGPQDTQSYVTLVYRVQLTDADLKLQTESGMEVFVLPVSLNMEDRPVILWTLEEFFGDMGDFFSRGVVASAFTSLIFKK